MERRISSIAMGLTIALLLVATWLIAGCEQERSPVAPDQESFMAPGNGNAKSDPHDDDAKGNPHDDDEKGDPHDDDDADGDPKAKGKGKGKGRPHVNGGLEALVARRGAVKVPLWDEDDSDLEVGWAIGNTTAGDDGEGVEALETPGVILILTVHLNAGVEEEGTYEIYVDISSNVTILSNELVGELTTNHKGKGTAQVKINLGTVDGGGPILVEVELEGPDDYETHGDLIVQLKE